MQRRVTQAPARPAQAARGAQRAAEPCASPGVPAAQADRGQGWARATSPRVRGADSTPGATAWAASRSVWEAGPIRPGVHTAWSRYTDSGVPQPSSAPGKRRSERLRGWPRYPPARLPSIASPAVLRNLQALEITDIPIIVRFRFQYLELRHPGHR